MYGEVIRTEALSARMVRVVLGGPGLDEFEPSPHADSYVNCAFLPPGAGYQPPFTEDQVRPLPREQRPYQRRISVRAWDPARRELTLDIVTHGETGHAGRWAMHARPGDRLQFKGPAGAWSPDPAADWYLLVGDESALSAIATCAEAVPEGRPVTALIEVDDADSEIAISCPGNLDLKWIHRSGRSAPESLLADATATLAGREGKLSAFIHGEAESIRAVRRLLLAERQLDVADLSCSPYWKRGLDDEGWRQIKGDWVRQMNTADPVPGIGA